MKYFLGIDGGGTRTTAAVSDENGEFIYKSTGKTINFYSVGMENARNNLLELMGDIYSGIGEVTFERAFVGCSALDNEAEKEVTEALCGGVINAKQIDMNSDAYVALFSGACSEPRCVVICGTGSMAVGIDGCGKITVKGGWGHIIGDGGSAYSIAVNALAEAVNLYDEKKFDEPLVKSVTEFYNAGSLREIIDILYSENITKDIIAEFARTVAELCDKGDKKALAVLSSECKKLVRTVASLVNEIEKCKVIYLYGGVFQNNKIFKALFVDLMGELYPEIKTELLSVPPEEGALKLARGLYE